MTVKAFAGALALAVLLPGGVVPADAHKDSAALVIKFE